MSIREYWTGSVFVVDWTLTTVDGTPLTGATVTGTVRLPDGTTAPMTVTSTGNVYTASYQATSAGRHVYALAVTAGGNGAYEGVFVVRRSQMGLQPITVDPSTDIGRVRLLATDIDEVEPLFEDASISAFLAMETGVKRAAALALETIAVSEALVGKKIRTGDGLSTDGPAVAKELRERAKTLRDRADADDDLDAGYGLEIVNYDPHAAYRVWGW